MLPCRAAAVYLVHYMPDAILTRGPVMTRAKTRRAGGQKGEDGDDR
jgi:hypothetical protein